MAELNLEELIAQARMVTPTAAQWFVPANVPPEEDPFVNKGSTKKPWEGALNSLPGPGRLTPSAWLRDLYNDSLARLKKGYELLEQPGITAEKQASYLSRLEQLTWQIRLLEYVLREHVPCPPTRCSARVGGATILLHPDHHDRYAYELTQAHSAGKMGIKLVTPGGRKYTLVPWKSNPPALGELDPMDIGALARVGALVGMDELTLLDRLQGTEVQSS